MEDSVFGAEGILIHGDKIVLGMQKQKRWYLMENGEKAAIIKTIGGAIEEVDKEDTKKALIREILEEIKGIKKNDIKVSKKPIFTKEIKIGELNPYEKNSNLKMKADFYIVEIKNNINLTPNDLPALIEIPKKKFYNMKLAINLRLDNIKNYIIKEIIIPDNYAIMVPKEVKELFKDTRGKFMERDRRNTNKK